MLIIVFLQYSCLFIIIPHSCWQNKVCFSYLTYCIRWNMHNELKKVPTLFHCNWLEVKTANIVEPQTHSFLQWHDCKNHKYVMRSHCCLKIMQLLKIWKCSLQSSLITKTTLWSLLILTKKLFNYTGKNCNYCRSSSAILFTVAWL